MNWQPIETAPKDGTWIVAIGRLRNNPSLFRACVTRWAEEGDPPVYGEGWSYSAPGYCDLFDATQWVPLPMFDVEAQIRAPLQEGR